MTQRFLAILAITWALKLSVPAFADTTYTYTGDNYFLTYGSEGYSTSDNLSGQITLANALAPGTFSFLLSSVTFSFNDGVHVIDSANVTNGFFALQVNALGNITNWAFALGSAASSMASCNGCFLSLDLAGSKISYSGGVATTGTWQKTSVPEGSSMLMLGFSAIAIMGALRRRFAA